MKEIKRISVLRDQDFKLHVYVKITIAYQTDENAKKLNDVGVSDRVETAEEGVENRDASAQDDGGALVHVDDDRQRGAQGCEDACRPEDFAAKGRQKEEASHPLPECVLKRIQHRDVPLLSHLVREENTTCDRVVETIENESLTQFKLISIRYSDG